MKLATKILILLLALAHTRLQKKNTLQRKKDDEENSAPYFPTDLPDSNQDGFMDEGDFINGFKSAVLTPWEVQQIFMIIDMNKSGKVDIQEWRNFKFTFMDRFIEFDKDKNELLNEEELKEAVKDINGINPLLEDEQLWKDIINDMCSSHYQKDMIDLYEYLVVRQNLVAWSVTAGNQKDISINSLAYFFSSCLSSFATYDASELQMLLQTILLDRFDNDSEFLPVLNLTHTYLIFKSMLRQSSINGSMTFRELRQNILDHIGPTQIFDIEDLDQRFTIEYAFHLRDSDDDHVVDFKGFYLLINCINSVRQYGKEKYGQMNYDEFKDLLENDGFFGNMANYISKSYLMEGDYKQQATATTESEAHVLSQGNVNPMQARFAQMSPEVRKHLDQLKLRSARLNRKNLNKKKEDGEEEPAERTFTLEMDQQKVFFDMFANHVYNGNLTYGDLFRMLKYCKLFGSWDTASHTRNYVIAPNKLTNLDTFGLGISQREKEYIIKMKDMYTYAKRIDHVTYDLPIDFMGYCRFMCIEDMIQKAGAKDSLKDVSYQVAYEMFQYMGLIPFNTDVRHWAIDLNQGMNAMKVHPDISATADQVPIVMDVFQAFKTVQLRCSRQMYAKKHFKSADKAQYPVTYITPKHQPI